MAVKKDYIQKTPEEYETEKDELLSQIKTLAESFSHSPENIAEMIAFSSRFYQYSINNQMLIYLQNPYATFTGSYMQYKQMGYSVNKGEKGMKILVPTIVTLLNIADEWVQYSKATKEQQEQSKNGLIETKQLTKFKIGHVFDIAQTNCPVEDYPKIYNMGYSSEQHSQIFDGLVKACKEHFDCEVKLENYRSIGLRGQAYTYENVITLNEKLQDTEKVSTLSHEIGHYLMHHNGAAKGKHPSQIELEADIFSILLQTKLGVELTDTRKQHLAEQFKTFEKITANLPEKEKPSFTDVFKNANEAFKNSYSLISESIDKQLNTVAQKKELTPVLNISRSR